MAITFVANGTAASNAIGNNIGPGLPTGWAQNDIFLLFACNSGGDVSAPTGYTLLVDAFTGSLAVFWKRAGASESAPTLTNSGGATSEFLAIMSAWRGCTQVGSPVDSVGTAASGSGATVTATSDTIVATGCQLFMVTTLTGQSVSTNLSGYSGGMTASVSVGAGSGAGNGINDIWVGTGSFGPGATGSQTATLSAARTGWATILFALAPPPPPFLPDEDFWLPPNLSSPFAVPQSFYQRLPVLPDPEEIPAGSLLKFTTPDEDFDAPPNLAAPFAQPAVLYQRLPVLPDPEEIPANTLVRFSVPDEDFWLPPNAGPPFAQPAVLYQQLPYPRTDDPEELPANSLKVFTTPDEDFDAPPNLAAPFAVSAVLYQQLPYPGVNDPEEIRFPPLEEWYWPQALLPAPVPASMFVELPILPDPEELPANSLAVFSVPDEDFWLPPGMPPAPVPASMWLSPLQLDLEEPYFRWSPEEEYQWPVPFLSKPPWPDFGPTNPRALNAWLADAQERLPISYVESLLDSAAETDSDAFVQALHVSDSASASDSVKAVMAMVEGLQDGSRHFGGVVAPWRNLDRPPGVAIGYATVTVGAYAYAFGGVDGAGNALKSCWKAAIAPGGAFGGWQPMEAFLPEARAYMQAFVVGGKVYLCGGLGADGNPRHDIRTGTFDLASGRFLGWGFGAPLPILVGLGWNVANGRGVVTNVQESDLLTALVGPTGGISGG